MLVFVTNSCEILDQIFSPFSSFFSSRQLEVVLVGKLSQEYSVNAVVPQGSHSVLPPLGSGGGDDFCVISQAGVETGKLQGPGWGHNQGGMILGSQAGGGGCFIMTNCWYFHKMLRLEFYKFRLRRYIILNFIASIL